VPGARLREGYLREGYSPFVRVLSIVHQEDAASGVFAEAVKERGDQLTEWVISNGSPPDPPDSYNAVLIFGGAMHVDQEPAHPWLRDEDDLLRGLAAQNVPMLGVCLGAQLIAKTLGGRVGRMPTPQIGWFDVEQTPEAADDPVFSHLPKRFSSFQWHSYAFDLPPNAVPLARDSACLQAYRAGKIAWGIQFHAEVTKESVDDWFRSSKPPDAPLDFDAVRRDTDEKITAWNDFGRRLCSAFLNAASSTR
jgi:GMP synthase (glutamine-hydrolysing)